VKLLGSYRVLLLLLLLLLLLQAALHDPILSADSVKHGSDTHRSKARLWQGLTAAVPFLCSPTQQEAATQAVKGEPPGTLRSRLVQGLI